MIAGNRVKDAGPDTMGNSATNVGTMSVAPSQQWKRRLNSNSSEGDGMMLEALVEYSQGGRRTVLQYIKMLSVIALPVAAVICLVSFTLHNSRVERAMAL